MAKYIYITFEFDRLALGHDLRLFLKRNDMTNQEFDELIGARNWVGNVISDNTQAYAGYYPSMRYFLRACNAAGLDPRNYFASSDRLSKSSKRDYNR